ncbi:DUF6456 domain-containing protein [Paenochrobactrum glaciei]|uniref:DUF6456 domain-containing protein n=1 Tax=Paenochrobactrum glaciei TaxID=486407 RepID=A0ABN1FIU4_9HYPH
MNFQATAKHETTVLRVLKFLQKSPAKPEQGAKQSMMILNSSNGALSVSEECLVRLAREGYLLVDKKQQLTLSQQGVDYIKLQKNKNIADICLHNTGKAKVIKVNLAESPLAVLYRMKTSSGQSFLTESEFNAGERLRSDFTRGSMMPRITANWEANVNSHSRGALHGSVELSDGALSARLRVEKALDAVGPELSGALVDICCFLKTVSQVEAERLWPARSAKMMIKTGLSMLHRHYHPVAKGRTSSGILHWGAHDYRPAL